MAVVLIKRATGEMLWDMECWLNENCGDDHHISTRIRHGGGLSEDIVYGFKDATNAMAFKLRWV